MIAHGITTAVHQHGMHGQQLRELSELPAHLHAPLAATADTRAAQPVRVVVTGLRTAGATADLLQRHAPTTTDRSSPRKRHPGGHPDGHPDRHPDRHLAGPGAEQRAHLGTVLVVLTDAPTPVHHPADPPAAPPGAHPSTRASSRVSTLVSAHLSDHHLAALRAGAHGVVHAGAPVGELIAVIDAAARGFTVLPAPVARALCAPLAIPAAPQVSPQERAWLRQLATGACTAQLAARSSYCEREMYRLLRRTYQRLGAANRTEALLIAQRAGLLST
ncbi:hypothetical protein [Kineococcus sp. SYSU DK005]|uniref:hypothetical protein n=1 Tax=Kineococcus sp. SYSU DK005 TaxID=3383126 RepID=UPI003D7D2E48